MVQVVLFPLSRTTTLVAAISNKHKRQTFLQQSQNQPILPPNTSKLSQIQPLIDH